MERSYGICLWRRSQLNVSQQLLDDMEWIAPPQQQAGLASWSRTASNHGSRPSRRCYPRPRRPLLPVRGSTGQAVTSTVDDAHRGRQRGGLSWSALKSFAFDCQPCRILPRGYSLAPDLPRAELFKRDGLLQSRFVEVSACQARLQVSTPRPTHSISVFSSRSSGGTVFPVSLVSLEPSPWRASLPCADKP